MLGSARFVCSVGRFTKNRKVEREVKMANFNRVILMGNLTRDVQLRFTQNETAVTDIGLAINERRKDQSGEWVDEPVYVDVTLWARTAEVASEYLSKGSPVLIEGRLRLDTWEDNGQKRSKLRVVGERLQMLGGPKGSQQKTAQTPVESASVGDDIPF